MPRRDQPPRPRPGTRAALALPVLTVAFVALGVVQLHAAAATPAGADAPTPPLPTTPTVPQITVPTVPPTTTPPVPTIPEVPELPTPPGIPVPGVPVVVLGSHATAGAAPNVAGPAGSRSAPRRDPVRIGQFHVGPAAALRLTPSSTALLVLGFAVVMFLVVQSAAGRRNPRFVAAPIDRREAELEFE